MCRWTPSSQIMGKCGLFELIAGVFIALCAISFVVFIVWTRRPRLRLGYSPPRLSSFGLRPNSPNMEAAVNNPTAAEA